MRDGIKYDPIAGRELIDLGWDALAMYANTELDDALDLAEKSIQLGLYYCGVR